MKTPQIKGLSKIADTFRTTVSKIKNDEYSEDQLNVVGICVVGLIFWIVVIAMFIK